MAARSPSPNPSKHSNPHNSKTPEAINPVRKSINFSSSKTTTNPCDSPLRSSVPKIDAAAPSLRASFEHKENERDLNASKPVKMRSPSAASSKGAKNFMAPTISASSKAIAASASPRKKILGERNELVRSSSFTSVSDSFESPAMEKIAPQSDVPPKVSKISSEGVGAEELGSKPEAGFRPQDALSGIESKKSNLEVKNHHHAVLVSSYPSFPSPSSAIAPLDADPSLPPYDPKTNYLSPRPQFLHYKPNPRIENYLNGEGEIFEMGEGKRLEDSFSSESYGESSGHTEEAESSSQEKNSEEEFSSEVEAEECINGSNVSEPECSLSSRSNCVNPRLSFRLRCIPIVLVLFIACFCVPLSDSPVLSSSSIWKAPPAFATFRELYDVDSIMVSGLYLRDLASRVGDWSIKSFAYYYASMRTFQKEEVGPFCAANLTVLAVDQTVDVDHKFMEKTAIQEETRTDDSEAERVVEENIEKESVVEYEEEKRGEVEVREAEEIVREENEAVNVDMDAVVVEEVKEDKEELEVKMEVQEEPSEDGVKGAAEEGSFSGNEAAEIKNGYIKSEPQRVEIRKDGGELNLPLADAILNDSDGFDVRSNGNTENHQTSHGLKLEEIMKNGVEHKISMKHAAGIASLIIALATTSILLHMKRKQAPFVATDSPSLKEVITKSVSGSSESYLHPKGSPYQNSLIYMDMMGDSGPSELSTSLNNNSSSYGHQRSRKVEEEALSNEKRTRRESAVSSSSSYGSFTTYEKVSCKKGNRDEEAMTPVRRSSRIRNLVASP